MLKQSYWRSGTAFLTTLGLVTSTALPLVLAAPASARSAYRISQLFPGQQRSPSTNQTYETRLPVGTVIPVKYEKEKVLVTPDETAELKLTVARNLRSRSGEMLIPAGSTIEGELRPAGNGTQFVAEELILTNGTRYNLDATSQIVTRRETVRKGANAGSILKGAAIGGAAAAVLAEVLGDIDLGEVLIGAGAGALGSVIFGRRSAEVVVIEPEYDLSLRLNSALALR